MKSIRVGSVVAYRGFRWPDESQPAQFGLVTRLEPFEDEHQKTMLADILWSDGNTDEAYSIDYLELVSL